MDETKTVRSDDEMMPCGHTVAQAAWLGCTEDGRCRPDDDRIVAEWRMEKGLKAQER